MKKLIGGLFIISCAFIPTFAQADTYTTSLSATADTYVRKGAPNTNEGASPFLRIRGGGDNRGLVQFTQSQIAATLSGKILISATLELEIEEAKNNWGKTGREVLVHRLVSPWSEGNGKNAELPPSESDRGDGIGATWNCAKDQNIANQKVECADVDDWEMRLKPNAPFGAPWMQQATDGLFINKGQEGTIAFDVTADVQAYLSGVENHGWIIRKSEENRPGYVSFFSREGTSAPQLVLTFADPVPVDNVPPVIAAHANITVAATSPAGAEVIYDVPLANDNIDGPVAVTCDPSSGYVFEVGTTIVSCTAEDAAGNVANSTFTVTVTPFVAPDTTAPVIEAHADISVSSISGSGAVVSYTNPLATDNVDGPVAVSCTPASGSLFAIGTTTVTCTAQDIAGNGATSTFAVGVAEVPPPVSNIIASQPNDSFLCAPDWRDCFTFGGSPDAFTDLGLGSALGTSALASVTIAKDENDPNVAHPWLVNIYCFSDIDNGVLCSDWGPEQFVISAFANTTTDNKYWTATFTGAPVFNPAYFYRLVVNDDGVPAGAYGSGDAEGAFYFFARNSN